jgi:hypothetical protein
MSALLLRRLRLMGGVGGCERCVAARRAYRP